MHEACPPDEHVYCNTDIECAKLVRVKATFPFRRWNMHEKMHRNICERRCCTGSAVPREVEIFYADVWGLWAVVMTRERNCFRLCTLPRPVPTDTGTIKYSKGGGSFFSVLPRLLKIAFAVSKVSKQ